MRDTRPEGFPAIIGLTRRVHPGAQPRDEARLASHLRVFPEGQYVAAELPAGRVVGMAAA